MPARDLAEGSLPTVCPWTLIVAKRTRLPGTPQQRGSRRVIGAGRPGSRADQL